MPAKGEVNIYFSLYIFSEGDNVNAGQEPEEL